MDNVKFKAFVPTSCKASEDVNGVEMPSEDQMYQTTESDVYASLQELYFGKAANSPDATNPFSTLSNAETTPFGCAVDPLTGELVEDQASNPYYVPTLKEITERAAEKNIPMTLDVLDKIKENYATALTARKAEKAKLEELLTQGGLSSNEANAIKQQVNYLTKAVGICESAATEIETLRNENIANFAKEAEDVKNAMLANNLIEKFNCGTVKDKADIINTYIIKLDHNGDGYIGDPNNGLAIVDTAQGKALYDESSATYIIRCAASGLFVTDKMPLPTTPWDICGAGLMNTGMAPIGEENLVLEIDDSTMVETSNITDAKVQMNVPEFMVVRANKETGEPESTVSDDGETRYLPAQPADGSTTVDPASDPSKYCAVRITSLVIEADDNDGMGEKSDREGYDMIYKYMAGDAVAYQIRVTGKNGKNPASDYAHAVNSGDFPITVDASYAIFTGSHCISQGKMDEIRAKYLATDEKIKEQAGDKAQTALDAFNETMKHFQTTNGHVDDGSKDTCGIIIQGRGHFIGAENANNLYLVTSPEKIKGKDDATKATIIENSENSFYNAVFANGNGDVFAQNMTLAHVNSTDKNASIGITMKVNIDSVLEDGGDPTVDADYKNINIRNYASLMGKAKLKQIDNPSDTDMQVDTVDGDLPEKNIGDDYYNGSHIKYSSPNAPDDEDGLIQDLDANGKEDGGTDWEAVMSENLSAYDEAVEKLDDQLESPYADEDAPDMGGEQLDLTTAEMDAFYSDLSASLGIDGSAGMSYAGDEEVDTGDIENPEKAEEKTEI